MAVIPYCDPPRPDRRPDPRLPRLAALAGLVRMQAVAALAANHRRDSVLAAEIAALRADVVDTAPTAYACAGGAVRRSRWCDARIAALNTERAQLRSAREALARSAAHAVARDQVLERLLRGEAPPDR